MYCYSITDVVCKFKYIYDVISVCAKKAEL